PVWEDTLNRDLMPYDRVLEPVVAGKTLFLAFNDTDKLVALDTDTGEERWAFYTDGPIRFAPVVWEGHVYIVSDDGCLYCLDAAKGEVTWKTRGAPEARRLLGNSRLISTWPARGAPVVHDGIVYWAAGIWPFMGTFIYAQDTLTGDVVWLNDGDGSTFQEQPHGGAWSFGGVGPQGYFVVSGDRLLVPGGRSVPAAFDRKTGELKHYLFHDNNKTGGSFVCADETLFFNHYRERVVSAYDVETGEPRVARMGKYPVLTPEAYYMSGPSIRAFDAAKVKAKPDEWVEASLWELPIDSSGDLIKAGQRLYVGSKDKIVAVQLSTNGAPPSIAWSKTVEGGVERLVAADDKLFAVTVEGRLMVFGAGTGKDPVRRDLTEASASEVADGAVARAKDIVKQTGVSEGYALFYGVGDGSLLRALADETDLRLIAFDPDANRVDEVRRELDAQGLYDGRIAVAQGDPVSANAAPYLASLTVVHDLKYTLDAAFVEAVYRSVRPYGGMVWVDGAAAGDLKKAFAKAPGVAIPGDGLVSREGSLEGAGQWTHYLGDPAQTGKSDDKRVKLPLGLLWFGGNTHEDVLTRHGHGPPEQIVDGRLVIQGMDCMSARDVYTGRVLWRTPMTDFDTYGVYYDQTYKETPTSTAYNQVHIPGANVRGTNFVVTSDSIYVIQTGRCDVLDPVSGEIKGSLRLPSRDPGADSPAYPAWGYIGVYEDLLVAGADFVKFSDIVPPPDEGKGAIWENYDTSASRKLVVMDRHTGEPAWQIDAECGFLHNGIALAADTLFCLDKAPPNLEDQLARRGKATPDTYRLRAYDIRTGDVRWEKAEDVFGSFLAYSKEHDILVQSTRPARDTVRGEEGKRIIAYRGKDGTVVWDKKMRYPTFPLIHGDRFVTEGGMFDLQTGEQATIANPLTGEPMAWEWKRMYGCNYPIAAENLLTFRSGAAGYYDLAGGGGTGNFGGFKSSCTSNLIAADGVLNAPDYTRTCSCSYPNQTSLALVHTPSVEKWTFNEFRLGEAPIQRIGVNLGAPGDRLADDNVMWLEYPVVGGATPKVKVSSLPEKPRRFLHQSLRFNGDHTWVTASGVEGIESLTIDLNSLKKHKYTVRLLFAEPEDRAAGDRVFGVEIEGRSVLKAFDVVKEAGAPRTTVVKVFERIKAAETLTVALKAEDGSKAPPILCGVEVIAD
ncbi:MAG: PQQ-binding-like beta-propeller repeat protein, partial [bacterium]|nr:PQQ-binding-like beta-propeller repeat protein [bacterium]